MNALAGLNWLVLGATAVGLLLTAYLLVMSRRRYSCGHSRVNPLHNAALCQHLQDILPHEDDPWAKRRAFARGQPPLLAFIRWPLKSAGIFNPSIIEAQYRAMTEAVGAFNGWVYAAPWIGIGVCALIGGGAGLYAFMSSQAELETTARSLTGFTMGHLIFTTAVSGVFGLGLGFALSRRIKFNRSYGWGLVLETGDAANPWWITGALSSFFPRLGFAQLTGYFRGSSRHSGLANGFLMMMTDRDKPLESMRYQDLLGRPCPDCQKAGADNPQCPNIPSGACAQPLPPMDGHRLVRTDAERFTNRNAETLCSWMSTVAEAAQLSKSIEKKTVGDYIKGAGPWVATGLFILGTFFMGSLLAQEPAANPTVEAAPIPTFGDPAAPGSTAAPPATGAVAPAIQDPAGSSATDAPPPSPDDPDAREKPKAVQ